VIAVEKLQSEQIALFCPKNKKNLSSQGSEHIVLNIHSGKLFDFYLANKYEDAA